MFSISKIENIVLTHKKKFIPHKKKFLPHKKKFLSHKKNSYRTKKILTAQKNKNFK